MTFNDVKVAGTLFLIGSVQFIIALIIAEAIYPNYSTSANYISDLGVWGQPSAIIFNPSAILFGLLIIVGSYFIQRQFKYQTITILFVLAGIGEMGVGIFPENTFIFNGFPILHDISALLAFIVGGISAIASYKITKSPYRIISIIMGIATLVAFILFLTTRYSGFLGLGVGGMERMIAYPTLLWIISFGGYLLSET